MRRFLKKIFAFLLSTDLGDYLYYLMRRERETENPLLHINLGNGEAYSIEFPSEEACTRAIEKLDELIRKKKGLMYI